jgi:hypothetical protein
MRRAALPAAARRRPQAPRMHRVAAAFCPPHVVRRRSSVATARRPLQPPPFIRLAFDRVALSRRCASTASHARDALRWEIRPLSVEIWSDRYCCGRSAPIGTWALPTTVGVIDLRVSAFVVRLPSAARTQCAVVKSQCGVSRGQRHVLLQRMRNSALTTEVGTLSLAAHFLVNLCTQHTHTRARAPTLAVSACGRCGCGGHRRLPAVGSTHGGARARGAQCASRKCEQWPLRLEVLRTHACAR